MSGGGLDDAEEPVHAQFPFVLVEHLDQTVRDDDNPISTPDAKGCCAIGMGVKESDGESCDSPTHRASPPCAETWANDGCPASAYSI